MLLLTWHGTIVCLPGEGGGIVQCDMPIRADGPPPLDVELALIGQAAMHPDLGAITIRPAPHGLSVARYGRLLSADRNSDEMMFDRTSVGEWENFLPISAEDLARLQHILTSRWIDRATRTVVAKGGVQHGFVLELAGSTIDLRPASLGGAILPPGMARQAGPDRLLLADERELVLADPRSSALIQTAIWPVRARRTAETMVLAAHRGLLGREPEQDVFDRDVAGLVAAAGAVGLQDLLERMRPAPPTHPAGAARAPVDGPDTDDILRGWALREMTPWLMHPVDRAALEAAYDDLNTTRQWAALYRFEGADVQLLAKPDTAAFGTVTADRAQYYLAFLRAVAAYLPDGPAFTLCLGMNDTLPGKLGFPVFGFQREAGSANPQLPDIDFLVNDFYQDRSNADPLGFAEKTPTAVFAGSTTGGNLLTLQAVQSLSPPRLRAAQYFVGHPSVDFRLPKIVQTATPEVRMLLEAQPYCRKPHLPWAELLRHRFIISMDGNGATCSRVVLALMSNSVLLKYDSPHVLYYFAGLQPWVHYVPVGEDRDVDMILDMADRDPALFERIAANGRAFVRQFLGREQAMRYTAMLLELFAANLTKAIPRVAQPAPRQPRSPHTMRNPCGTYILAHVQDSGDMRSAPDGWVGEPGSLFWIEGFAIHFGQGLPPGITYAALLADGVLCPPVMSGEYCGTRSANAPVYGFRIDLLDTGSGVEITYEAHFVDGSWAGPVQPGVICRAKSGAALEAMRVIVQQGVLQDT